MTSTEMDTSTKRFVLPFLSFLSFFFLNNRQSFHSSGLITSLCFCSVSQEMTDIVRAIYDMMGKYTYPVLKTDAPRQHVDAFFQVPTSDCLFFFLFKHLIKPVRNTSNCPNKDAPVTSYLVCLEAATAERIFFIAFLYFKFTKHVSIFNICVSVHRKWTKTETVWLPLMNSSFLAKR